MTVWRKLDDEDCYAVALYNFNSSSPLHLPLEVGELVHLERETDDWYWGTSLRRDAKGAFPKSYAVIRSCNVDRCGETVVASTGGSGVVHDIAVTLREWLQHWKLLYTTNDDRFKFIEVSMRALLELRAQAASGALPQDQLRRVARTAVFTIDKGNRTLGMELAVRTVSGQLVDPLTTSTFKLNAMHDEVNSRIDKNMETTPTSRPTSQIPTARTYTIVVHIKNFVCRMSDVAELSLALHDSAGSKITENVLLKLPPGHLGAAELFTVPSVVFTDLGSDIKKEKLFLVCHVVRLGAMEPHVAEHRRSTLTPSGAPVGGNGSPAGGVGGMRRPFGVACADITQHLANDNSDKEILLPFFPCEKDNMDTLLKKVIANREPKDKHSQGLWVFVQMAEGDLKQIRQENPDMMVRNTAFARKMGFPEVILPGDARNELYVTLLGGAFTRGPGKSAERNVQLSARVLRRGAHVPGVISVGAGVPLVNEYTSIVYYHDDRPRWNEVFKVCLNIEEFKEAHIVFLCRHRSSNEAKDRAEKYFALSYLRLMQKDGTTIPDGQHNLAVYKLEHKKGAGGAGAEAEAGALCAALPSLRAELPAGAERGVARGPLALQPRDCLAVATRLCSTKLTQREEILGVLKWSTHHAEGTLRSALTKLLRVPNDELVKFLQDILDALFSILTQVEENTEEYTEQSYAVLVLDCLLQVISLVADHKYQHFQPVLHVYIEKSFCDALAYEKLISIMVWAIRSVEQGEVASKRLLQCMKCLESLSRVLVRSWQLRAALGSRATALSSGGVNGDEEPTYCTELQSLLEALVWLMRCGDAALTCQGSALKYLPAAAPHLARAAPAAQLSQYTVWALEALPLGRLSNQRLHALLELVRGPLGAAPGPRALLLPHVAATLAALLAAPVELDNHKSRSAGKAARLLGADTASLLDHTQQMQIMELCVETLGEVVSLLARDDVGPVEADRGELARSLLPTVLRVAATMMKERNKEEGSPPDDPLLRKLICVLLDMVRQMSEEQYVVVMKSLDAESSGKANALVSNALALMMALLQRPVFRPHWADMLHLQHHVMLHALRLLSTTLREQLGSVEDGDPAAGAVRAALQAWFGALGAVASSPPIQLEALPTARRQRATQLYGDIRRKAATLLADMWFSLEEHKRYFIPHLVGTFLEVSFLRVEEVRNIIIPLFFDMMQTEYKYTSETEPSGAGNMRAFENALIDKLDVLAEAGQGDAAWRASFVSLVGALAAAARLPGAAELVAAAARQLDALLQYRAAPAARRLHEVVSVLHFYENIERPHMYVRYVHRLAALHAAADHAAEAGLALCLHAKLLRWGDEPLPPRLRHPAGDAHDTHFQLKWALYEEAMTLLEKGRQWELAVRLGQEMVREADERGAAHGTLAALHEQLARLHRRAGGEPRPRAVYFRVRYLGRGFPPHLHERKGFVYRGNDCDMLHNFKERMLDEWPEAEVLLKLDEPGEDITQSDGQYLQINAVTPIMDDIWKKKFGKSVDEQILRYYEHNNVKKFVFSRPYHRQEDSITDSTDDLSGANEFATRWLQRTELEISDTLPGILRWFPVVSTRTYWMCPLEVAVETMEQTNKELKAIILEAKSPDAPLHPLTMRLQGILDSGVQGGLVHYERAFLTPAYAARRPQHAALLQRLRDLIADQVPLLQYGLSVHARRAPVRELHAHLAECFGRVQRHVHQLYGRRMCEFETETVSSPEVTLRTNQRDSAEIEPRNPTNRISDISTGNETTPKSKFKLNSTIYWPRNSSSGTLTPRHKKRSRKSEVSLQSSGSQWYTSASANGNIHSAINNAINSSFSASLNNALNSNISHNNALNNNSLGSNNTSSNNISSLCDTSASPLRELRQELVCSRPQRSQRASLPPSESPSNRDSMGTTDSNQDDEEPPPLPQKQSHKSIELDAENNNQDSSLPVRHNYDLVISPRNSYLYQSRRRNTCEKLPPSNEKAPTPPPKKRNQNA